MAHFAKIENSQVIQVIALDNSVLHNTEFPDSEPIGQEFIRKIGLSGLWLQTSYNGNFRKNYAGVGYTYNRTYDAFIAPKPHHSWKLNPNTCIWESPIPHPADGLLYMWDEQLKLWIEDSEAEVIASADIVKTPPDYEVD